jgi:hypothetical protein
MKVGEKVECIDDEDQGGTPPFAVCGRLYEITAMVDDPMHGEGLQFAELEMGSDDFLFASRFRPILDRSLEEQND